MSLGQFLLLVARKRAEHPHGFAHGRHGFDKREDELEYTEFRILEFRIGYPLSERREKNLDLPPLFK